MIYGIKNKTPLSAGGTIYMVVIHSCNNSLVTPPLQCITSSIIVVSALFSIQSKGTITYITFLTLQLYIYSFIRKMYAAWRKIINISSKWVLFKFPILEFQWIFLLFFKHKFCCDIKITKIKIKTLNWLRNIMGMTKPTN